MSAYARTPEHGVFTPPPECPEPKDHEIVKGLKKRIEEYKSYKQGRGIISENKPNSKFTVVDISDDILRELQKLVEGKE